ncbi:armadillo-like helical domain-containing protein 3 isoform X1 [Dermatophagoides pteronyssinus]|uniref:armadillo-like helical domain-containing protein 3 isoform X1 n=1 Tax=Dermatophagoides pteronyssinus TaxID=6956 RepID=UPI003F68147D
MLNKNSKKGFKEKIVQYYIDLIKDEESSNENFWNEFFLLKANGTALKQELDKIENFDNVKKIVNILFEKSIEALQDSNQLRILNGLVTLFTISHHIFFTLKSKIQSTNDDGDIPVFLCDNDENSQRIREEFVENICLLLFNDDIHSGLKSISLKLLAIITTSFSDINSNRFLENFMSNHRIFDGLMNLFISANLNHSIADKQQHDELWILLVLTIFLNYQKPNTNPFMIKLSIVDNDIVLNRYSRTITNHLMQSIIKYDQLINENKTGLFSSISNMVGTIFSNEDNINNSTMVNGITSKKFPFHIVNLVLLALYEAVSLNRNFISLLTTVSSSLRESHLSSPPVLISFSLSLSLFLYLFCSLTKTLTDLQSDNENESSDNNNVIIQNNFIGIIPTNLLVTFLEFSSIIMLGIKDGANTKTARLCFIILTCITEDASANSIIHDNNMSFIVNLRRMPMRHRKVSMERNKNVLRPICHTIMDLMIEFILTHLNRQTKQESFGFCLGIVQRILCFQKRFKVRINFDWKELWSSLILLIKFLLNNETYFFKQQSQSNNGNINNMFAVLQQIIIIFNIFILYGDNFLHNDHCYDELYYEIIRMHTIFDNLNSFALRHMTKEDANNKCNDGDDNNNHSYKEESNKLINNLINIKAIIAHLNIKLELYSQQNKIITLSEQQVFDIVRNNYDTLTLKLVENIDSYEPYNFAKCNEIEFFNQILYSIIEDLTTTTQISKPSQPLFTIDSNEQHNLIQEIQTMFSIQTNITTTLSCSNDNDDTTVIPSSPTDIINFNESILSSSSTSFD